MLVRFVASHDVVLRAKSGIYINPDDWSDTKGELKTISKIASQEKQDRLGRLKEDISSLTTVITNAFKSTPIEKINKEWLEKVIHDFHFPPVAEEESKEDNKPTLIDELNRFIVTEKKDSNWKDTTAERFVTLRNHLTAYQTDRDVTISFETLDKEFFDDFADFLKDKKGLRNTTNAKNLKLLKWFLRWAVENSSNDNRFFENYTPGICKTKNNKNEKKVVVFLNDEELKQVKDYDFTNNKRLEQVRDVFMFCCYSGLRYSDVENLTQSNIYDDMLHVTTIKTSDTITIDLNDTLRSILAKYHDDENPNAKALPVVSNQKMNVYLKEMAKICGIDQPVTKTYFVGSKRVEDTRPKYEWIGTHTGRRTFICRALSKGIAADVVMEFTGHKDYKAMKPYIAITQKAKKAAMDLFND